MGKFIPLLIEHEHFFFDDERIAPDDEMTAREIHHSMSSAVSYGEEFGAAVQLFDFSHAMQRQFKMPVAPREFTDWVDFDEHSRLRKEAQEQADVYSRWLFIAARDGAITLYNLGRTMEGARAALKNCASLNQLIDHDALSKATKMFRQRFPRFEALRHMVAHDAEFSQTQKAREDHAAAAPIESDFLVAGPRHIRRPLSERQRVADNVRG